MKILNCGMKSGTCTDFKWLRVISDKNPSEYGNAYFFPYYARDLSALERACQEGFHLTYKFINLPVSEFDNNCSTFLCFQFVPFSDFMGNEQHLPLTGTTFSDIISFSGPFSFSFFIHSSQLIKKGITGM